MSTQAKGNSPSGARTLDPDSPIANRTQDTFGRTDLAIAVSEVLLNYQSPDSVILGIEGSWGSGKTSVLNLIEEQLGQLGAGGNAPKLLRFHPTWFSPGNNLPLRFFEQVSTALHNPSDKALNAAAKAFAALSTSLASVPGPGPWGYLLRWLGNFSESLRAQSGDIETARRTVSVRLTRNDTVLWIVLDDLDRLQPNELVQLLSLMRGVGDLPNVRYILAYDRDALLDRIESSLGPNADAAKAAAFLEKFVQFTFLVPDVASDKLLLELANGLDRIHYPGDTLFEHDADSLQALWHNKLERLITTPRSVKRLLNSYLFSWQAIAGQVDPLDLLALEAIRTSLPDLYRTIPSNVEVLTGAWVDLWTMLSQDDQRKLAIGLKKSIEDHDPSGLQQELLEWLFPPYRYLCMGSWPVDHEDLSRRRRISSREHFDTYFRLALGPGILTRTEVHRLKAAMRDSNELTSLLRKAHAEPNDDSAEPRSFALVDALQLQVARLCSDAGAVNEILLGVFNPADDFGKDAAPYSATRTYPDCVFSLVLQVSMKCGQDVTAGGLAIVVRQSPSIYTASLLLERVMEACKEDRPERQWLVSRLGLNDLRTGFSNRLESLWKADNFDLEHNLHWPAILAWQAFAPQSDLVNHVTHKLLATDAGFLSFVEATTGEARVTEPNDRMAWITRVRSVVKTDYVSRFVDVNFVRERIREFLSGAQDGGPVEAVRRFAELLEQDDNVDYGA